MLKRMLYCLVCLLALVLFSSCCGEKMEAEGTSDSSASEAYFLEMEDDLTWKDNSLDAYSARICVPISFQKKDGCVDGIRCTVITNNYGCNRENVSDDTYE